jgi:thiol-disulfide isomerase/thioredoxin
MKLINSLTGYETALNSGQKETVMIFNSNWCKDSAALAPYVDRLEPIFPSIDFYWVEREKVPVIAKHLNVYGVPSIIYYQDDQLIASYIDPYAKTIGMIVEFIEKARQGRIKHGII